MRPADIRTPLAMVLGVARDSSADCTLKTEWALYDVHSPDGPRVNPEVVFSSHAAAAGALRLLTNGSEIFANPDRLPK